MGCISPKPEKVEEQPENVKKREIIRRESQRPWNRASAQVYCGDPKKGGETQDTQEKSPDEAETNKQVGDSAVENSDAVPVVTNGVTDNSSDVKNSEGVKVDNNNESNSNGVECSAVVGNGLIKDVELNNCDTSEVQKNGVDMNPPVQKLTETFLGHDIPLKLCPPPLITAFDPGAKIIKRPRSLDAVENYYKQPVIKSRPLSYSPGLRMKTKHPRSLHSIEEIPKFRERPKSIDFSVFYHVDKDSDHIQKLRRLLTQKGPKKSKTQTDHCVLDKLVLQPNQVKYIEDGPSRCFQPSQMIMRKTKNRDFKLKEVEYLRRAIGRPRMKFSKSIDIFIQRNNQYFEYDPFLDPLATQPGNPWLTDDPAFWDFNKELVEIPTVTRVKKWALSFDELLSDETGCTEFEHFLKKEYSHENIRFYKACKELIIAPLSKVSSMKNNIESEFLTHGALCEVNIDAKTMEMVREKLKSEKDANRFMFQPAMEHVYALMKKDSYTRFLRSEEYKQLQQNAQSHFNKKRNLFFGSNKKKVPSPTPRRRGSGGSGEQSPSDTEIGGLSYHSYSTGNLRELDDKPKRSFRTSNSPSLRRRTDAEESQKIQNDLRRRSNLDVPRTSNYGGTSPQDPNRKSEAMSQCLALSVPGKTNIVTPWEGQQASN